MKRRIGFAPRAIGKSFSKCIKVNHAYLEIHPVPFQNDNLGSDGGMAEDRNDQLREILYLMTLLVKPMMLFLREQIVDFTSLRLSHIGEGAEQGPGLQVSGDAIGDHGQGAFEHVFQAWNSDGERRNRRMTVGIFGEDI